ncbi:kynureninase [Paenisporosarcina cavernae]|uniref:Kynureninase n=1 Tax=Paenisporosarcina cavernae TaxID=2320858 RepID=A0A385YXB2_9BACL|nr:kynureninase [Paenisporosarcina cavernae]AYC30193.1 kynureninase [Paenisporosarcina cavernae]
MTTREHARKLDEQDLLASYRQEFTLPDGKLYMDGNSLGLAPKRGEKALFQVVESWKEHAIDGWTEGENPWFTYTEALNASMAKLIGAKAHEVMVTGSITVNIHQMLSTFYQPTNERSILLVDELNFPSDIYAAESHVKLRGLQPEKVLRKVASEDGYTLSLEAISAALTEEVAVVLLPSVLYRSGQLLDIQKITALAHERGIIVGFDLAHSIGSIPHDLHAIGVDFAVWCNYKYVNGGPGSVGGLYIHERHHHKLPGLAGWFGSDKAKQFDMSHDFTKASDAGAYQIGTPHMFSLAPIKGSLELFDEVGIDAIREKSLQLTTLLRDMVEQRLSKFGVKDVTPIANESRGGHIALAHPEAARICKALKEANVIPDFRAPDIIRLAPISFYTSFEEVVGMVERLEKIMQEETYKKFSNERNVVA